MERSGAGATKRTQIMAKREKLGRYCREREREREIGQGEEVYTGCHGKSPAGLDY